MTDGLSRGQRLVRLALFALLAACGVFLTVGPLLVRAWSWVTRPRSPDWWGAGGQWAGAVGTIAAVIVALWIAIRDNRQLQEDRRKSALKERQEQASRVTAWIESAKESDKFSDGSRVSLYMVVSNANSEAINHVIVSFDIFKSLPTLTPYIHRDENIGQDEFLYAILPPGKWRMPVREGWRGMSAQPGVMVAFSDSRNCHWVRMTDGTLTEYSENAIRRRKIYFPQGISAPMPY